MKSAATDAASYGFDISLLIDIGDRHNKCSTYGDEVNSRRVDRQLVFLIILLIEYYLTSPSYCQRGSSSIVSFSMGNIL